VHAKGKGAARKGISSAFYIGLHAGMRARKEDGRAWFDRRYEKETHLWLVEMAINHLPLSRLFLLQDIAILDLASKLAALDGEPLPMPHGRIWLPIRFSDYWPVGHFKG
jgi:hypothetical protein